MHMCDGQNSIHMVRSRHRFTKLPIAQDSPSTLFRTLAAPSSQPAILPPASSTQHPAATSKQHREGHGTWLASHVSCPTWIHSVQHMNKSLSTSRIPVSVSFDSGMNLETTDVCKEK